MIKNYLKIALRNIKKYKGYSFINITGLAVGLAVCILLMLYVQHELSFDRFNEKADSIYRLCNPEHPMHAPQTAGILAEKFPEIKNYARIKGFNEQVVEYKNNRFKEKNFGIIDPSFFEMFSCKFVRGNGETALKEPFTMVITQTAAKKYFGDEDPVGKALRFSDEVDYKITAVMEDMPQNSHFRYDFFLTLVGFEKVAGERMMNNWGWLNFLVYFEMQDDFSKTEFEKKCSKAIEEFVNVGIYAYIPDYTVQNIKDIHLHSSHFLGDIQPQNSITYVLIFSAIGILLLLIACFNYVNLLTASAISRSKEIGLKKVVGATRGQLAMQFIGESMVIIGIAFSISLIIVQICLPNFNTMTGKMLTFTALFEVNTILGIIGVVLATGILSGFYPAFFLSRLKPVKALKNSTGGNVSKFNFRKILVGIQFTVVIILVSGGILMFQQVNYLQHKDMGFDKEYILLSDIDGLEEQKAYVTLKNELLSQSIVSNVAFASRVPSTSLGNAGALRHTGKPSGVQMPFVHISHDYFKTLGIEASQGRLLSNKFKIDIKEGIILNKSAVKELELQGDPIGQILGCTWPKSNRKIVGIVDDFHFESLYNKIKPTAFLIDYSMCGMMMVKMKSSNVKETIQTISSVCKKVYPAGIFEFHLLEAQLESRYQTDTKRFKLMGYFIALTIFIAFMGLFGLATFMMKSRTKEMGIRKVLGATAVQTFSSLTKSLVVWILFANLFAWPVSYYFINKWLQNFAYRIDMTIMPFLLSGVLALAIALATVSFQAVKAATTNPIDSLKYE